MPRHTLRAIPRLGLAGAGSRTANNLSDDGVWDKLDRVQVLGDRGRHEGHTGCVNALSWSDDGSTLLSGSDDKRICIWGADSSSSNDNCSPHPLKLLDTILTGHRANIFSAKYLPNTSTPTIVSCAGDSLIKIFEVERLGRAELGRGNELWGESGTGVRTLRCHQDRTKRIATENSPHLFLTVSEDGTVRQHDLRRPHECRSECPEPLFFAPRGVDLYSLSVSPITPHLFCVAGRTDCAFVCDRRMLQRQTPSWGTQVKASGQVHCVRRLGLTKEDWKGGEGESARPSYFDKHVTCVKMSPHQADEVIVSFASHSTSLFSLYDDPAPTSARHTSSSPTLSTSRSKRRGDRSSSEPSAAKEIAASSSRSLSMSSNAGQEMSTTDDPSMNPSKKRPRSGTVPLRPTNLNNVEETTTSTVPVQPETSTTSSSAVEDAQEELRGIAEDMNGHVEDEVIIGDALPVEDEDDRRELRIELEDMGELEGINGDEETGDEDDGDDMELDDEDWFDDDDIDEEAFESSQRELEDSANGEFGGVEMLTPRRSFKGARNSETVKDCNFLGLRSDKVCSGSDDGNFFVWDKTTGRLDGIWEGDGSIVNVMEQHPTLPLVAVSGIDDTVKIFAPPTKAVTESFSRIRLRDSIIQANLNPRQHRNGAFTQFVITPEIMRRIAMARISALPPGQFGDEDETQQCMTQ